MYQADEIKDPKEGEDERRRVMSALAYDLLKTRDEAVQYRSSSGIERQWEEDTKAFEGMDALTSASMLDYASGDAMRSNPAEVNRRSKVLVNIIRGRCETAEGRFSDMLLPTDDKNWGLKPTPVPTLSEQLKDKRPAMQDGQQIADDQGKPATMSDVASDISSQANKAMDGMETEVNDQLTECDYNGELRKLVRQAVRMGTGVLKGPNVVSSVKKAWKPQPDGFAMDMSEDFKPASSWVDCWNLYPSPGTTENVQKTCEYMWEKDEILPRDVRDLMKVEGYYEDQLAMVLDEVPKRTRATYDKKGKHTSNRGSEAERGQSYEKWEGYKDLNREDLEVMGCDCSEQIGQNISAYVVFINDRVVKVELNVLDSGDLPYDFFQWTQTSTDSPWGVGIVRQMIWLQRIVTASWRAMLDNAGDSARPTIVTGASIQPMSGNVFELGGIFTSKDDMVDIRKAFGVFEVRNNQQNYQSVIELALRFVDLETSIPTIFQGEAQEIPETLGATNIMVDSANIGLRHRVKLFDDQITRPHITRYYDWNMQYSKKEEIKGDFNVDPRGVSALIDKDQQAQLLLQTFQLKQDPSVARLVDWDKATEQFFKSRKLDILKGVEDLAKYDEKIANAPPGETNPQVESAKIRTEGSMQQEQLRQQSDMAELEFKASEAKLDREHQTNIATMERDVQMMKLSQDSGIALDKIKTQLAISGAGMNLQRDLSDEKKATPEVVTPPTEPAGKAPVGRSFER